MARPNTSGKPSPATPFEIAAAMAAEDSSILKQKKVSFGAIQKAIDLAKGFNKRFAVPEAFTKEMARLEAEGRSGGLRGKPKVALGETRTYTINNANKRKGTKVPASLVVPMPYEWAQADGAKAKVFFDKNNVIITKG